MTHEIKNLVGIIWKAQQQGIKSVLATVVAAEMPCAASLCRSSGRGASSHVTPPRRFSSKIGSSWPVMYLARLRGNFKNNNQAIKLKYYPKISMKKKMKHKK